MRRIGWMLVVGGIMMSSQGCALMHDVQPHRLWRFNRGPSPSSNPYFSVSDPIPQTESRPLAPTADDTDEPPVADRD